MSAFTIDTSTIRQVDGLYSLNDLHKASGGEDRHAPNRFVRLDTTQALITEISKTPDVAFKATRGRYASTYACRELVIAYAAWISAAFHLKVIRVFLDATAPTPPITEPDLHTLLGDRRWTVRIERSGQIVFAPMPDRAYVLTAEDFARFIREPGEIPRRFLPDILAAAAGRLTATEIR